MNTPNKLTILRILLVPVCLLLAGYDQHIPAAIVFALACITDTLDGYLARKNKLITNFGKFADPIADKILVLSMMIVLCYKQLLPVWLPVILVFRELLVDGLRMVAAEQGRVVAAGWSGKIKTVCQMVLIVLVLVFGVMLLTNIYCIRTMLGQHDYYLEQALNHYLEQQMEMMQQKIKHTAEAEKNISIYRHDLRHILATIGGMLSEGAYDEAASYIEKHSGAIGQDVLAKWCVNPVFNAMFAAYFAEAEKQDIQINAQIDISDIPDEEAAVFSLVCANAIENAIHAVTGLPRKDRIIRVRAIQSPQFMFSVSNPYRGSIMLDENGIPTSGEEGHGIGISSMLALCEKHHAVCDFKIRDGWFAVRIVKK